MVVAANATPALVVGGASLIVGPYDLLNPGSPVRLWNDGSTLSFGAPVPDTAAVARLLTDGEVVTGVRASNRTLVLPVLILGTRRVMAQAVAALARTVDQAQWQIVWTPDGGEPPVVFDCYRGSAVRDSDLTGAEQGVTTLILTVPALPFTRAASPTVLVPPSSPVGQVVLDSFANLTGLTGAATYTVNTTDYPLHPTAAQEAYSYTAPAGTLAVDSTVSVAGAAESVKQTVTPVWDEYQQNPGGYESTDAHFYWRWSRALGAAANLTNTSQVIVQARTDLTSAYPPGFQQLSHDSWAGQSGVAVAASADWRLTLTSAGGSATWKLSQPFGSSSPTPNLNWSSLVIGIDGPAESKTGTFDVTAVLSYRLELWQEGNNPGSFSVWLQSIVANPSNGGAKLAAPYGLITFPSVAGSARTPVSLSVGSAGSVGLGALLLARTPNAAPGFAPVLSDATRSGSITSTGSALTGAYSPHATWVRSTLTFNPSTFAVLARVYNGAGASASSLTFTAAATGDTTSTVTLSRSFTAADPLLPAAGAFGWVTLGAVTLPPRAVDGANSAATITFTYDSPTPYLDIDLVVLVDMAGEILFVTPPAGTTFSQWFADAPFPGQLTGTVHAGTKADRSDAVDVSQWLYGQPVMNFDPGPNTITAVLDNDSAGGSVQATYYPRWPGESG